MATHDQLKSVYNELLSGKGGKPVLLLVVPLIRYQYKLSDYLYLLYQPLIDENESYRVESLSVWKHWKIVWKALFGKNVILHYHWLECTDLKSLAGMSYKWICVRLFKLIGGKLVWTLHNKMPHDRNYRILNYRIRSSMAKHADLLAVHCQSVIGDLSRFYNQPEEKFRVVHHPSYPTTHIEREDARNQLLKSWSVPLSSDDQLFLMFGNISSYKNIDKVCQIFTELDADKKLLVVGPVKKGQMHLYHKISSIAKEKENIKIVPYFVPEEMVPVYFNAADCVIFHYEEILTSGGVVLAQSYNKTVIAPNLGCLSELDSENSTLFQSEEQLERLIRNFQLPEPDNG